MFLALVPMGCFKTMKIVQVNKTLPPISEGLQELGHEIVKVNLRQDEKAILRELEGLKPDLVIFHKLGDKDPMLTREASKKWQTWFWMPDPMFNVWGRARDNVPAHALNCHFCSAPSPIHVKQLWKAIGKKKKVHMVHNVVPPEYRYVEAEKTHDIGFLGTKYKWRQRALTEICKGRSLLLYGGGYPNGKVSGVDYALAVSRTRIQLNMAQREDWPGILSSRSFRILACRGLMLAQTSKDFEGILQPMEHYVPWTTPREAWEQVRYYLDSSTGRDEGEDIAARGERWVLERFLPIHQAKRMREVVNNE